MSVAFLGLLTFLFSWVLFRIRTWARGFVRKVPARIRWILLGTQADSLILYVASTGVIISQSNPRWMQALGGAGVASSSGSGREMGRVTHRQLSAQHQASSQRWNGPIPC